MPSFLIRLEPRGPFRISAGGPEAGSTLHSDVLFSALCEAAGRLGWVEELRGSGGQVRISSAFPYLRDTLFAPPPKTLWPPAAARVRFDLAQYVPAAAIRALLRGEPLAEERWAVDAQTGCLLQASQAAAPFRRAVRTGVAVDRVTHGRIAAFSAQALEFAAGAGFWCVAEYEDQSWGERIRAAFRVLGDSGIGAERSRGWGRFEARFESLGLADIFGRYRGREQWMLSLYAPAESDEVDWARSNYRLVVRAGRTGSRGVLSQGAEMAVEGSVIHTAERPQGACRDVTPPGSAHPVIRAGFAVSLALPERAA